jgi:hypothetical protein
MNKFKCILSAIKTVNLHIIFVLVVTIFIPSACFAVDTDFYSKNDILFYNPSDSGCSSSASSSSISTSSSGFDRLKAAVKAYGQTAMNVEREYGVPWEVVLAQMQKESSVGTAGIAVDGADNNWLGITGSGDAGSWTSSSGRKWAKYSSVDASIKDWAGPRVLRNGAYDSAFKYLDPNNYNIDSFVETMISVYAPASDGNDDVAYKADVLSFINGPIREAAKEQGWPSSAELAKNENIAIGGKNSLGSSVSSSTSTIDTTGCSSSASASSSKAVNTAISFVNDDGSLNSNYVSAVEKYGNSSNDYTDCGLFVGTIMRASGADSNYPQMGTSMQYAYVTTHTDKYTIIPFTGGSDSELQPGDILLVDSGAYHHTSIWTGTDKKLASASLGDYKPKFESSASWFSTKPGSIIVRLKL